jgi:hypothetical protein
MSLLRPFSTRSKLSRNGREDGLRWSPFVGQFGGVAKLGSVSRQAANLSFSPLRAMPAA